MKLDDNKKSRQVVELIENTLNEYEKRNCINYMENAYQALRKIGDMVVEWPEGEAKKP